MLKEFIDRIIQLSEKDVVEVEGRPYTTKRLGAIKSPVLSGLNIHTLTGIVDFIKSGENVFTDRPSSTLHIESPGKVTLYSEPRGAFIERHTFITAKTFDLQVGSMFGNYMSIDQFIVNLQSMFVPNEDRAILLKFAGNIVGESVMTFADDGVTQAVESRVSVSNRDDVKVPSPVTLIPFRTFLEVAQPASEFVFRVKKGRDGNPPLCAIFESDGGGWKNTAIQSIKEWLKAQDMSEVKIIA